MYPDYAHSIVNTTSSILKRYGCSCRYKPLALLDERLKTRHRNVVLMVFDGLGSDILERNLPADSFLRSRQCGSVTSVFPSTTTAAMTAYYTGEAPNEHGWIGWSLFFKEYSRTVDIFPNKDSYSDERMGSSSGASSVAFARMPYVTIYERIREKNAGLGIYTIMPEEIHFGSKGNENVPVRDLEGLFANTKELCAAPGEKFIFSYWNQPDSIMHFSGCESDDAKKCARQIDEALSQLSSGLRDTIIIVSADHGQTAVTKDLYINDYPDLFECLIMPPSIEVRAATFFVKKNRMRKFRKLFKRYFGREFLLLSRRQVFAKRLLGLYETHPKVPDFIGDFVAVATGSSLIRFRAEYSNKKADKVFKGHHAGITPGEMLVPIVIIET